MGPLLIIGNVLTFIGSILMMLLGLVKKKKMFLITQMGMNGFFTAGFICLGGVSGAVVNFVTMVRNVVCLKWDFNKPLKVIFIGLQAGLTLLFWLLGGPIEFGWMTVIFWLPVIANCVFTWFMDSPNMIFIKALCIGAQILWGIYDFTMKNYATVPFDIATIITNIVGIILLLRDRKKQAELQPEENETGASQQ